MDYTTSDQNVGGQFDDGDPLVPRLPTQVSAKNMNDLQNEIIRVLIDAGITPSAGLQNQLSAAVVRTGGNQTIGGNKTFSGFTSLNGIAAFQANVSGTQAQASFVNSNTGGTTRNLYLQNADNGPALDVVVGGSGNGVKVANSGTGASLDVAAGVGANAGARFSTSNVANPAAVYALAAHDTQAVYAEKTNGTTATTAAVYAKSTGHSVICETTGTVRAPLRIVGTGAAPSSATNGDVYYDTGTNKLRVRAAGAWVDLH